MKYRSEIGSCCGIHWSDIHMSHHSEVAGMMFAASVTILVWLENGLQIWYMLVIED